MFVIVGTFINVYRVRLQDLVLCQSICWMIHGRGQEKKISEMGRMNPSLLFSITKPLSAALTDACCETAALSDGNGVNQSQPPPCPRSTNRLRRTWAAESSVVTVVVAVVVAVVFVLSAWTSEEQADVVLLSEDFMRTYMTCHHRSE